MKKIEEMTISDLLDESTFIELFNIEDSIEHARTIVDLRQRAKQLGSVRDFNEILKAYKNVVDEELESRSVKSEVVGYTNFEGDYPKMQCGDWVADDTGVYQECFMGKHSIYRFACYHPILPISRMRNLETLKERIEIAFKRRGKWETITVAKEVIASANKIVALADYGIAVTSESAKHLVKYLSDIENLNDFDIPLERSSSKMGWHENNTFLPYDDGIIFDGELDFKDLTDSVKAVGSREKWMDTVKALRKTNKIEIRFALAASLASILVDKVGGLPFVVDFWSKSGGGKTVLMMLAASIWASPEEHRYIGNFDQTMVGLEVKADLLNSLPMMLDDTSNATKYTMDEFERLIYMLCSGKGKSRSNKTLGMQRERHWRNCTLMNGEKPISDKVNQGGAINRIIECLCSENIFDDPRGVLDVITNNYGFIGKEFVELVKRTGEKALTVMFNAYNKILLDKDKTAKQTAAAALILTADKLATDSIFDDGIYLDVDEVSKMLVGQSDMSDDVRCYKYLLDMVASNHTHFNPEEACEQWGLIEVINKEKYIIFYKNQIEMLCDKKGFSLKSFLNWANTKDLLLTDSGRKTKNKKINGMTIAMIFMKVVNAEDELTEFIDIDSLEIPF